MEIANTLVTGKAYIDGKWKAGVDTFDVSNPATGETIGAVADLQLADVEEAVIAAHRAWLHWKETTAANRSELLKKWQAQIVAHKQELAEIMTWESGKPITESLGEVDYGVSFVEWYAEEAKRAYGETIPAPIVNRRIVTIKQAVGVVAAITPWNFPMAMITRKVAPAVAAGCTTVLRPAAQTPLTALALAILAEKAGWPAGVFNIVTGRDAAGMGNVLTTSPLVRKLSFTGSTEVGQQLMQQASSTIKKISLELGGNAPFIVFEDADISAAVRGAVYAKHRNSGQTCIAVNRFLIHDSVFDEFAEKYTNAIRALKVGEGIDPDTQIGPLINKRGLAKVGEHVADAVNKGALLLTGGKRIGEFFYAPTVLADVSPDTLIAKEETFGPVSALFRFQTEDEALKLANNTDFGLAAYIYSNNVSRCWRVATLLEAGMVGVNEGQISAAMAPFGGVKASGIGREGSHYGLEEYLEIKYLCFGLS